MTDRGRHIHALPNGYRLHWYEIDGILGQGGFGITYLAHDVNLNQRVAIKEYLPTDLTVRNEDSSVAPVSEEHFVDYKWGLARFIREAQTLARFKHTNIVAVNAVFEENNTAYLVMEYVEGEVLEDAIRARKVKKEERLLEILYALLDGLELIHEAGYIHRDIKPDNIYLRDDGSPVLLDFGSARQAFGSKTETMTALVSPGYAPYEQYDSSAELDKQGPWTDIYALGASFYRAVTGRGPVEAIVRMHSILEGADRLRSATEIGKGWYSARFLAAIDAALSFRPGDRPQTVAQWRSLLPPLPGSVVEDDSGFDLLLIADEEPIKPVEPGEEETVILQAPLVEDSALDQPSEDVEKAADELPKDAGSRREVALDDEETVILAVPLNVDAQAEQARDSVVDDAGEVDHEEETVILQAPLTGEVEPQEPPPATDASEIETVMFDFPLDEQVAAEVTQASGDEQADSSVGQEAVNQEAVETVIGLQVDASPCEPEPSPKSPCEPVVDTPVQDSPSRLPQFAGIAAVAIVLLGALWWYTQQHQVSRVPTQQLTDEQVAAIEAQRRATRERREREEQARLEAQTLQAGEQRIKDEAAARLAEEQRTKDQEAARQAEEPRIKDEEATRVAQEQRLKDEEAVRLAEAQRLKDEEAARLAEAQRLKDEEAARLAEAQRLKDEEAARLAEAQRLKDEEAARLAEAQRLKDEEAARLAEAQRLKDEEAARLAEAQQLKDEEAARLAEAQQTNDEQSADSIAAAVEELLRRADADIGKLRLTSPPGNNAVERLKQAALLDPTNNGFVPRYERIVASYIELARTASSAGQLAKATTYLDKAESVYADSPALETARSELAALQPGSEVAATNAPTTTEIVELDRCEPKLLASAGGSMPGVLATFYEHKSFSESPLPKVKWVEYSGSSVINGKGRESAISRYDVRETDGVSVRVRKRHKKEFDNGAGTANYAESMTGEHVQVLGGLLSPIDELRITRTTNIIRGGVTTSTDTDTRTRTSVTRVYEVAGQLFPLKVGNHLSYKSDRESTTADGERKLHPHEGKPSIYYVEKTQSGASINSNLGCDVYVIDYRLESPEFRDTGKYYFSEELGLIAKHVGQRVIQTSDGRAVSWNYERTIVDFELAD